MTDGMVAVVPNPASGVLRICRVLRVKSAESSAQVEMLPEQEATVRIGQIRHLDGVSLAWGMERGVKLMTVC